MKNQAIDLMNFFIRKPAEKVVTEFVTEFK